MFGGTLLGAPCSSLFSTPSLLFGEFSHCHSAKGLLFGRMAEQSPLTHSERVEDVDVIRAESAMCRRTSYAALPVKVTVVSHRSRDTQVTCHMVCEEHCQPNESGSAALARAGIRDARLFQR